jgi:toxin YoeB
MSFLENFPDHLKHRVSFIESFRREYLGFGKNRQLLKKIDRLILEIAENPRMGKGSPEKLNISSTIKREIWSRKIISGEREVYSRRIDEKNRLIYEIVGQEIIFAGCKGHYGAR